MNGISIDIGIELSKVKCVSYMLENMVLTILKIKDDLLNISTEIVP